jgi:hypothetical protein
MTEHDMQALEMLLSQMEASEDITPRLCAKCGEDVTYWVSPCAEPGCPAVKPDA